MNRIVNNITELIGQTPLIQLNNISRELPATILGKAEFMNPSNSVKDRAGFAMISAAENEGHINKETVIIEPTSGNTGIALAFICSVKGYKLILTMPESMSLERRKLLKAYGAELILTPAHLGMKGAIEKAEELSREHSDTFIPQQFSNKHNPNMHYRTTGPEIWEATQGNLDMFVAGVGTGGTVSGTGRYLKEQNEHITVIGVEPHDSPVLSGGEPGPHMIQGIGAGFIPENYASDYIDGIEKVTNEEAIAMSRKLIKTEGLLLGISSGANVHAAVKLAKQPQNKGKTIVTILCDYGERYLSTTLYSD